MMNSKIMMLLWERWQRTRWAVIGVCLLFLARLLNYVPGFTELGKSTIGFFHAPAYFVILIPLLLLGQCEARHLDLEFPKRLFRFPVSTPILFTVHMGYNIVAIALPFLISGGIEYLFFSKAGIDWPVLLTVETAFIAIQTLAWLGGPARFLYITFSLLFLYVLYKIASLFNWIIGLNTLCWIIILLCCMISLWNISKYRHGGWLDNWKWVEALFGLFTKRRSNVFKSPLNAQIWFEFRQIGHLFPLASLCFISPFLGWLIYVFAMGLPPSATVSIIVPSIIFLTIPAAWISGMLALGIYYREHTSHASAFFLRRPMATRTLAFARLYAIARSILYALAIISVIGFAIITRDWITGALGDTAFNKPDMPSALAMLSDNLAMVVTMVVFGMLSIAIFCWTIFRLPIPAAIALITMGIIYAFTGDNSIAWSYVGNALILLAMCVIGAFIVAMRRNLIKAPTLVIAICLFPVVVVSLWAYPWGSWSNIGLLDFNRWQMIRLVSAATLPFLPVALTPLIMNKLRHR